MENFDNSDTELLIDVATRFYLNDQSKVEIGKALDISRFRVARLLAEAKEKKIVTIQIAQGQRSHSALEEQLAAHLRLSTVIIIEPNEDQRLEWDSLARAAAHYLNSVIKPQQIIGMSWGRTLLPIAAYLESLPPVTFIQLTGVVGNDASQSPIEIISRIRLKSSVQAKALIAPLFARSRQSAQALRGEPHVADVMELYKKLDVAVLSVGSWEPKVTQLDDSFEDAAKKELDQKKAVADFSGIFFDKDGKYVDTVLNDRRLSVEAEALARTPIVMAVAGGAAKTAAIHAVCMTGLATCLVTTLDVAELLLERPAVLAPTWERN